MSGSSKSSSSSSNTTNNIDGRSVADAQGQSGYQTQNVRDNGVLATNSTVTVTDFGAINSALYFADDVTNKAIKSNENVTKSAFGFGNEIAQVGLKGYEDLLGLTGDTFQGLFDVIQKNNDVVQHISETSTDAINQANKQVISATDNNRYLVAGGLAVVALVAVKIWSK